MPSTLLDLKLGDEEVVLEDGWWTKGEAELDLYVYWSSRPGRAGQTNSHISSTLKDFPLVEIRSLQRARAHTQKDD